jgi:hypothetical protein
MSELGNSLVVALGVLAAGVSVAQIELWDLAVPEKIKRLTTRFFTFIRMCAVLAALRVWLVPVIVGTPELLKAPLSVAVGILLLVTSPYVENLAKTYPRTLHLTNLVWIIMY